MARPLRIEYPGALYHITARGDRKRDIFLNDMDRHRFIATFALIVERFNWHCHAYCLMNNHYHILLETIEGNLSNGMRQLNGIYSQRFNAAHDIVGHVFQGRYKAFLIEKESYLLEVARYVVLNPVRAGLVELPQEWEWSSYLSNMGQRPSPSWLTTDWILGHFDRKKSVARQRYQQFIVSGIGKTSPFDNIKEGMVLGSFDFIDQIRDMQNDSDLIQEIPKDQRFVGRPTLEELFDRQIVRHREVRNEAIRFAHSCIGYSQKEIADHLGLHYSSISKIVNYETKL